MPRFTRNTVVLAKTEVTYGTDLVPVGTDAILVSNPSFKLSTNNVKRDFVRPYFGASEELVGTRWIENGFEVELVGGGTAGTPPPWGPLVEACAFAKDIEATVRVDYLPLTDVQPSLSIYSFHSGVRHKALGSRGKLSIGMKQGDIPKLRFQFMGLYGGVAAFDPTGVDFSDFPTPQVVTDANSTQMKLGATVNLDNLAPVITGGVAYPSLGIELDLGLEVPMTALVGGETIDVTDRQVTGKVTLDLTAAQDVTFEGDVLANTLTSISFLHGTVVGRKALVYLPRVQLVNPADEDLNGRMLRTFDFFGIPTQGASGGNDEVRIILF